MSDFEGTDSTDTSVDATEETVSIDYDSLAATNESTEVNSETESPVAEGSKNPAWDPILNLIPEQLHGQVIPHLSKTDKHVQQLQQTYAPFKQFIDQGITPDVISQSLSLGQAIARDPQAVYDQMREQFNLSHAETIQTMNKIANDEDEESQGLETYGDEGDEDEDDPIAQHPLFIQMQEQLAAVNSEREESRREQMYADIRDQVNQEWSDIEKKVGGRLSEDIKADIQQRALNLAGDNGMPVLMDGFNDHIRFVSKIRNSSANNFAPAVTDGTGLLPGNSTYDMGSKDGMENFIADFARSNLNGG